ncbi:exported protein of unknown function [Cardinium endosymbiont cEper1 of Encarsia pergandiella]|uniref:hypothetical protein n=1 Tax=Cardinium endosymbiont of Encarsia pergandiella TaxID=249402 RepID=UPI00027EA911|nr:hypothetical protein [Cardinium endosymbiont of Encarsia pergandiella]CCM10455.1 exported protein of unknown function [Cardinium endosymbiont cEper1 of Encarsia pergandiella]
MYRFIQLFKRLSYAIIISLIFTHQAAAFRIRLGTPHQDLKHYFYTGIKSQLGYASLNVNHPKIICLGGSYSRGAVLLGALVGRQWMQYFATELAFEWLHSYAGRKEYLFRSEPIKTDLSFYTLGFGLDCMPMLPVSDNISLLGVFGIGYKNANITENKQKIFDLMGWKVIPRIGLGVVLDRVDARLSLKLLTELNNLFKDGNQSVFKPSFLLGVNLSLSFK